MFKHLDTIIVEIFAPPGELLDEKTWHKDVWDIVDHFFRTHKNDPSVRHLCSKCQGLPYKVYRDLTLYYERRGLPAFKRKIVNHIINTLDKYHKLYNIVQGKSTRKENEHKIVPFKKPDTKLH